MSTGLIMFMVPGLGLFYAGLARQHHALSLLLLCMLSLSIVLLQWFLFGFSLAFSPTGGPFIGDFSYAAFMGLFENGYVAYPGVASIREGRGRIFQPMDTRSVHIM